MNIHGGTSQQAQDRRIHLIRLNEIRHRIQDGVILAIENQEALQFGSAKTFIGDIPFFEDKFNRTYRWFVERKNTIKCILLFMLICYMQAVPKNLSATKQYFKIDDGSNTNLINHSLDINKDNMCHIKTILQNSLNVFANNNKDDLIVNKKSDNNEEIEENFIAKEPTGLSCVIIDNFRYAMNKFFCWQDDDENFKQNKSNENENVLNYELENISDSISNAVEGIGQSLTCVKEFFMDIINDIMENQRSITNRKCDLEQSFQGTSFDGESTAKTDDEDIIATALNVDIINS